jgi:hypothetical protein
MKELTLLDKSSIKALEPADFEKDDDTNFHIDFITAASNMRGRLARDLSYLIHDPFSLELRNKTSIATQM